jgi:hypothetical protein
LFVRGELGSAPAPVLEVSTSPEMNQLVLGAELGREIAEEELREHIMSAAVRPVVMRKNEEDRGTG